MSTSAGYEVVIGAQQQAGDVEEEYNKFGEYDDDDDDDDDDNGDDDDDDNEDDDDGDDDGDEEEEEEEEEEEPQDVSMATQSDGDFVDTDALSGTALERAQRQNAEQYLEQMRGTSTSTTTTTTTNANSSNKRRRTDIDADHPSASSSDVVMTDSNQANIVVTQAPSVNQAIINLAAASQSVQVDTDEAIAARAAAIQANTAALNARNQADAVKAVEGIFKKARLLAEKTFLAVGHDPISAYERVETIETSTRRVLANKQGKRRESNKTPVPRMSGIVEARGRKKLMQHVATILEDAAGRRRRGRPSTSASANKGTPPTVGTPTIVGTPAILGPPTILGTLATVGTPVIVGTPARVGTRAAASVATPTAVAIGTAASASTPAPINGTVLQSATPSVPLASTPIRSAAALAAGIAPASGSLPANFTSRSNASSNVRALLEEANAAAAAAAAAAAQVRSIATFNTGANDPSSKYSYVRNAIVLPEDKCKHESGCARSGKGKTRGMCYKHGGIVTCTFPGCVRGGVKKGLCKAHGGRPVCDHESGCPKQAKAKGKCIKHGGAYICTHESGCHKQVLTRGLCIQHGGGKPGCKYGTCTKRSVSRGLCFHHGGGTRCIHEGGCLRLAVGKGAAQGQGLCQMHSPGHTPGKHSSAIRCEHASGCEKNAQGITPDGARLCVRHGGGVKCKHPSGCIKNVQGKGMCSEHGEIRLRHLGADHLTSMPIVFKKNYVLKHTATKFIFFRSSKNQTFTLAEDLVVIIFNLPARSKETVVFVWSFNDPIL